MGLFSIIKSIKHCWFPTKSDLGSAGKNVVIGYPVYIASAKTLHMEENTVLRRGASIQNNKNEHIYIGKYSVISTNVTIVTNNHRSTVGIPQCLLGASHINDMSKDIHIGEDVWVGTNVTILSGGDLGRGCIVGACSLVTKPVPPYALVVGSPAKIVGVKFSIEQILEHEQLLYPQKERLSKEELEALFANYYMGVKAYGVRTELSKEEKASLANAKEKRHYLEPTL